MTKSTANPASGFADRCGAAWAYAAHIHRAQHMPASDESYLHHLGMVSFEIFSAHLAQPLADLDLAIHCAILHDSIEDQDVRHQDLVERFGLAVADGVQALSKNAALPKAEAMTDSLARIRQQPQAVWCVKLADRISNLRTIPGHWTVEKVANYRKEAEQILAALGEANAYLAERLRQRIAAYAV